MPPAEPQAEVLEALAEAVQLFQVVTVKGALKPVPGVTYLRARDLPAPGPHDPVVFGPHY
jgi:hypothetical protein